jgi:alpha-glucosidase
VWYDYWTGKRLEGGTTIRADAPLETVPMYVRGGAIIPMGPEMSYTGEKRADPIDFRIHPDETGRASTTLYEDDGTSPAYKQGVLRRAAVTVSSSDKGLQIDVGAPEGTYNPGQRFFVFTVQTSFAPNRVMIDGKSLPAAGPDGASWRRSGDTIIVKIKDDGKARQIQIR